MTLEGARRAYLVFIGQEAVGSFSFMMVITAAGLFMIQDAHLDALQLVLVGTTLESGRILRIDHSTRDGRTRPAPTALIPRFERG